MSPHPHGVAKVKHFPAWAYLNNTEYIILHKFFNLTIQYLTMFNSIFNLNAQYSS